MILAWESFGIVSCQHALCVCVCLSVCQWGAGDGGEQGGLQVQGKASWIHAKALTRNDFVRGACCLVSPDKCAIILLSALN